VLDRQVVGAVAASRPVPRVVRTTDHAAPHRPIHLRRLEQRLLVAGSGCVVDVVDGGARPRRKLYEEEELVQHVQTTAPDVTTRVVAHVAKDRLNCVAIRVALQHFKRITTRSRRHHKNALAPIVTILKRFSVEDIRGFGLTLGDLLISGK